MKAKNIVILLGLGWLGYNEYQKFLKYIDSLKMSLSVADLEDNKANISIENLTNKEIPSIYDVKNIELINETKSLAFSNQPKINSLIAKEIKNPIAFNVANLTTKEEIEAANIAVTFNFFGFEEKRLYKVENVIIDEDTEEKSPNSTKKICGCGCGH